MEGQINDVMVQLFLVILKIAGPVAGLRLAVSGLKTLAGGGAKHPEEDGPVTKALRDVGLGLFIIFTSQTIVHFIKGFAKAVSIIKNGW